MQTLVADVFKIYVNLCTRCHSMYHSRINDPRELRKRYPQLTPEHSANNFRVIANADRPGRTFSVTINFGEAFRKRNIHAKNKRNLQKLHQNKISVFSQVYP